MKRILFIFLFSFILAYVCVHGVRVKKCGTKGYQQDKNVYISNCARNPCILKRRTYTTVKYTITPQTELHNVTNDVYARILGLPFPFIGVNGTSTCGKYTVKGTGEKASCPLTPGRSYVYKDRFKILNIYPRLKLVVHWALKSPNGEDILCFEVPARIV